jgi:hypothetical protein
MITFLPTRRVVKETDIDFDLLGKICTNIFEKGFNKKLSIKCKVWKSNIKEQSTMECTKGRSYFTMNLDTEGNKRYIFSTILHELRHGFQENIFRYHVLARFSSYNAYYNSKEERDARKQERLTTEVMKIYSAFKDAEEKFERFSLKELG